MDSSDAVPVYVLVDGENIDATLGMTVLGRKPEPDDRPRWDAVLRGLRDRWARPVTGLFFLNASAGYLPALFIQALQAGHWIPVPVSGPSGMKVVDHGIQRTLDTIGQRPGDVILASHDGDFADRLAALLAAGRRVGVLGFPELMSQRYRDLVPAGLETIDMEFDLAGFRQPLPRVVAVDVTTFDPARFLDRPPLR